MHFHRCFTWKNRDFYLVQVAGFVVTLVKSCTHFTSKESVQISIHLFIMDVLFSNSHQQVYFSLKWTKCISTMNDSVSEFNIQCISGFRQSSGREIQTSGFQIPPEPLKFSFRSDLLMVGTSTVSRGCFESESKHYSRFHIRMTVYNVFGNLR